MKGTRSNLMMKSAIDPEFTLQFDCSNPDAFQIQKSTGEYLVWEANYIGKPTKAVWGEKGTNSFWKVIKKWTRRDLDYYQITVPDHSKFVLTPSFTMKYNGKDQWFIFDPIPACGIKSWSSWSECSATCGQATRSRTRKLEDDWNALYNFVTRDMTESETCENEMCVSDDISSYDYFY
ncbi:unnamed protein product [Oikopleura dioica]|uniref:Uncharacterized protein n=1 Tax=Oikopleura dioica TaxID=34765 RepID=E4XND1_OIKDI|nr:unnamed protein product [Oikopleura dioica]